MSVVMDLAPSLLTAARGVIAAFGCLCIVVYALIPCLVAVGEIVIDDIPAEVANYKLAKAQQSELQQLEDRLAQLRKRHARRQVEEAQRAHEDYQTQAARRHEARQRKRTMEMEPRDAARDGESVERARARASRESRLRQPTVHVPVRKETNKTSGPQRRETRPLQILSPNVSVDRRSAPAYVKASAAVTKPVEDSDRSHHAPQAKSRLRSLRMFDEDEENVVPSFWTQR